MNKSDMKTGDVVSLNGSKTPLVVESFAIAPYDDSSSVLVCWLDLDGHLRRDVLDAAVLSVWTAPPEKPDHFPEVMAILSEAMKRIGVDSSSSDGGFEVDNRGAPEQDAPAKAPQWPWTSDIPSDRGD